METKLNLPALTIGRIVHYKLSQADADAINRRRAESNGLFGGNHTSGGQVFPAIVTRNWKDDPRIPAEHHGSVQIQVFLDGNDTYAGSSRQHRPDDSWPDGTFAWPTVVYPADSPVTE